MKSKNNDWFKYDKRWGQWSRVILRGGNERFKEQVEIPLNPTDMESKEEWKEIGEVIIYRYDAFVNKDNDIIWTHELPDNIASEIVSTLGNTVAGVLLNADILPLINWNEYNKSTAAYISLYDCIKSELPGAFTLIDKVSGYCVSELSIASFINLTSLHRMANYDPERILAGVRITLPNDYITTFITYGGGIPVLNIANVGWKMLPPLTVIELDKDLSYLNSFITNLTVNESEDFERIHSFINLLHKVLGLAFINLMAKGLIKKGVK